MSQALRILIPISSYQKIMGYAQICDQEVSGFADIEFSREKNAFIVGEVYLLEQEVGPAETEIGEEAISNLLVKFIEMGRTQTPRLWWHSHVNMGAFLSGTDENTMSNFKNESFMVALVVNKRKEVKTQVRFYAGDVIMDDIPLVISYDPDEISEDMKAEVATKVKKKTPKIFKGGIFPKKQNKNNNNHPKSYYYFIPNDRQKALELVKNCNFIRYDKDQDAFVYVNNTTGVSYLDKWHVLDKEDSHELDHLIYKSLNALEA